MESKELTSEGKIKRVLCRLDRKALGIGVIGLIVLVAFPFFATKNFWFDYNTTGQIGDTIGGLTAPIIGFFSALLIYLSFRAQIKANYIVQSQIDHQRIEDAEKREFNYQMEICKHIKDIIDNYEKIYKRAFIGSDLKGPLALNAVLVSLIPLHAKDNVNDETLKPIISILNQFDTILLSFKNRKYDSMDIRLPFQLVYFLFNAHILNNIKDHVSEAVSGKIDVPENVLIVYQRIDVIGNEFNLLEMAEDTRRQGYDVYRS